MIYRDESRYEDPYKDYDWDNDGYPGELVYGDYATVSDDFLDELWKPVQDFDGYWVSDHGRLYSSISSSFIYGSPVGRCGHIDISLRKNNRRHHRYMHRLVAEAFIPNPHNYPIVRHLDDDPSNNRVDNLAWGTDLDNIRDCIEAGRFRYFTRKDIEKASSIRRTPVVAVNLRTGEKTEYIGQGEAARNLGMHQSDISGVLRGERRHAYGYYFYYADKPKQIDISTYRYSRKFAPIKATDLRTGRQWLFRGQTEAANTLGLSVASVCCVLGGKIDQVKGYTFEYEEDAYGE